MNIPEWVKAKICSGYGYGYGVGYGNGFGDGYGFGDGSGTLNKQDIDRKSVV